MRHDMNCPAFERTSMPGPCSPSCGLDALRERAAQIDIMQQEADENLDLCTASQKREAALRADVKLVTQQHIECFKEVKALRRADKERRKELAKQTAKSPAKTLTSFEKTVARVREETAREAEDLLPTNWVDNLLSGDDGITIPADCPQIEKLIHGIKARLRRHFGLTDEPAQSKEKP